MSPPEASSPNRVETIARRLIGITIVGVLLAGGSLCVSSYEAGRASRCTVRAESARYKRAVELGHFSGAPVTLPVEPQSWNFIHHSSVEVAAYRLNPAKTLEMERAIQEDDERQRDEAQKFEAAQVAYVAECDRYRQAQEAAEPFLQYAAAHAERQKSAMTAVWVFLFITGCVFGLYFIRLLCAQGEVPLISGPVDTRPDAN